MFPLLHLTVEWPYIFRILLAGPNRIARQAGAALFVRDGVFGRERRREGVTKVGVWIMGDGAGGAGLGGGDGPKDSPSSSCKNRTVGRRRCG